MTKLQLFPPWERLPQIKAKHHPTTLFRLNQNIKP
jgi:hypothetical protein